MQRALPAWSALAGLLASCAVALLAAAPAASAAEEVVERPADGVFAVEGHGWGHGRGMSQWGAQGAASLGADAESILRTYYPGTARAVLAPAPIRVLLTGDEGRDTQVHAAPGLTVTDAATGATAALPAGPTRWRVSVDAAGLHVQSLTGTTWTPYGLGGATTHAGPVRFRGPTFVRLAYPSGISRDYRGAVQAVRASATALQSVVVLPLEDYLLGVVPRESSASWRPAALQAQAVAARSYSANKRARVAGRGTYDICDTTSCQVFGGSALYSTSGTRTELEPATTTAAVQVTAGVVRTYAGTPVFAEFSSSNGGWSTTGDFPYLRAARDDWDGALPSTVHSWRASLRASDLERRFPAVGRLARIRVTARDGNGAWGGRVTSVVLEGVTATGAPTSVRTTGAGVHAARSWPGHSDGLRSSWWRLAGAAAPAAASSVAAVLVAHAPAPVLVRPPGLATGTVTATVRNTGTTAWPTASLALAAVAPAPVPDPLVPGTVAVRNAVRAGAVTVAPGETATLALPVDAARVAAGTHARSYRLRLGTGAPFGPELAWRVAVQEPRLTAAVTGPAVGAAPGTVLVDGRTVVVPRTGWTDVRLAYRATGNLSWPVGPDSPVRLGTSAARNRHSASAGPGWSSTLRPGLALEAPAGAAAVGPGGTGSFRLRLHGNGRPAGTTVEAFEPLWAGRGWLEGAARSLVVVRVDPAVSRAAMLHSRSASAVTLAADASGRTTLVVRLRNLGRDPWAVGGERLGTIAGAAFPLASGWTSPARPPALAANAVRPGAVSVPPGEVGEWRVPLAAAGRSPGTYVLDLAPVSAAGRYGPTLRTTVTVVAAR